MSGGVLGNRESFSRVEQGSVYAGVRHGGSAGGLGVGWQVLAGWTVCHVQGCSRTHQALHGVLQSTLIRVTA